MTKPRSHAETGILNRKLKVLQNFTKFVTLCNTNRI
jgi:hypothetical protein